MPLWKTYANTHVALHIAYFLLTKDCDPGRKNAKRKAENADEHFSALREVEVHPCLLESDG